MIVLALDSNHGPLGIRLDEISLPQVDVAPELRRHAQAQVVIITFAALAITECNLGTVIETVSLQYTIEVVATLRIEPCGIKPKVIALDLGRAATNQVKVR
ncbi:hypothetical protein D3C81_1628830 [compost metagenome]